MECMYHVYEAPTPVVTYSFPFQMAVLGEISLGWKKNQTWNNRQSKWQKKTWQGGADGETFSRQLFESLFLFKIIAPLHNVINRWGITALDNGCCLRPRTVCSSPSDLPSHGWTGRTQDQLWLMGLKMLSSKFLQNNVFRTLHSLLFRSCFYWVQECLESRTACWQIGSDMPLEFSSVNFGTLYPLGCEWSLHV